MIESLVTPEGKLAEVLSPAVYFDPSVLIDYWVTEGIEFESHLDELPRDLPHESVIRDLLKTDRRVAGMAEIRKTLQFQPLKAHAVTSPLALLELIEWYAESSIRTIAARAAGAQAIRRLGKKDVGELLNRVLEGRRREDKDRLAGPRSESTGLEIICAETFIGPGFSEAHGLAGVLVPDIVHFSFSEAEAWGGSEILAYLQMGMADVVHLLVARHYGCLWVASFDSDFARCREEIKDGFGLCLLTSPEEIRAVLT